MARAILGLVIVIGILAAIIFSGSQKSPDSVKAPVAPDVQPTLTSNINKSIEIQAPVKVVVECERPTKLEDKDPKTGQIVMKIGKAIMGQEIGYLEIPDGWIKTCGYDDQKDKPGTLPGKAYYDFDVSRTDDFYIFIRAKWMDSCGNSVYVQLDGKDYTSVEDNEGEVAKNVFQWAWHPVAVKAAPKPYHLEKGKHTLVLATKEDGPQFDKVLIATDGTQPARSVIDP